MMQTGPRLAMPLVALLVVLALAGCTNADDAPAPTPTWYAYSPKQCGGNPWEPADGQVTGAQENATIRDWYKEQGVLLDKLVKRTFAEAVPAVCSAPRGYTVYVTLASGDASVLVDDGWQEAPDGPPAATA